MDASSGPAAMLLLLLIGNAAGRGAGSAEVVAGPDMDTVTVNVVVVGAVVAVATGASDAAVDVASVGVADNGATVVGADGPAAAAVAEGELGAMLAVPVLVDGAAVLFAFVKPPAGGVGAGVAATLVGEIGVGVF